MAKVTGITNLKGGSGKSTTAVSLAEWWGRKGERVLLIDTDPQCNATDTYRAETDGANTLYDLLFTEGTGAEECIQHMPDGDIIAADQLLTRSEQLFPNDNSRYFLMREKCAALQDMYDRIIIDTSPVMGVMLTNVFNFSGNLIIPLTCDRYGLVGMSDLSEAISAARKYTNPGLEILGLLLIKYNGRLSICRQTSEQMPKIAGCLNTIVFETKIRESVACREAQVKRSSLFEGAGMNSTTAQDYISLADEIEDLERSRR